MKMLGFELKFRFAPTTETKIWYYEWLRKIKNIRCRLFHDSTWVPKKFEHGSGPEGMFRWYCCRDCGTTWLIPMTGIGK